MANVNDLLVQKFGSGNFNDAFAAWLANYDTNKIQPSDMGMLAWNFDTASINSGTILTTAGTLYMIRLKVASSLLITNILLQMNTAGATLTSGQCFAGVWRASDLVNLGLTADTSVLWAGATGLKTNPLVTPVTVTSDVYIGIYANGTTMPTFRCCVPTPSINGPLTGNNSRWGTSSTALTTTPPPTAGNITVGGQTYWVGIT